ncbi:AAA family ATPase [candidate division KSB1 bacterium]|nr:AAA family ATPase [candidate division KSB1 bacterium]
MAAQETDIVIIDLNESTNRQLYKILQDIPAVNVEVESADLEHGFELIQKINPSIVILHLYPEEDDAVQFAERITQSFPDVVLFTSAKSADPQLIINSMRVGAREFLMQPYGKDDVVKAVKSSVRTKRRATIERAEKGKIIASFGVKGGIGATTVITNLATATAKYTDKEVIICDLNLQLGHVALFLNIKTRYTIVDVAMNIDELDIQLFKGTLPTHSSGLRVLSSPRKIEDAETIHADHVEQIFNLLKNMFDFIFIDLNHDFTDLTLRALDSADEVLIIADLDVATIYNTKRCLDLFKRLGYSDEKLKLVLNRYAKIGDADLLTMEKLLEHPVTARIPNENFQNVISSINKGVPINIMMPNLKISKTYKQVASTLQGKDGGGDKAKEGKKSIFKLFSK